MSDIKLSQITHHCISDSSWLKLNWRTLFCNAQAKCTLDLLQPATTSAFGGFLRLQEVAGTVKICSLFVRHSEQVKSVPRRNMLQQAICLATSINLRLVASSQQLGSDWSGTSRWLISDSFSAVETCILIAIHSVTSRHHSPSNCQMISPWSPTSLQQKEQFAVQSRPARSLWKIANHWNDDQQLPTESV